MITNYCNTIMATFVLLVTSFVTLFQHIQGDCDPGGECDVPYPYSSWECAEGSAWPPHFCRFSQLQLVCGDNPSFVLVTNGTQELPHSFLGIASEFNISVVDTAPQVSNGGVVKQIGDPVFVFTFYYYPPLHRNGGSNLFHLHVDTLIPVFGLLEQLGHVDNMLNRKSGHLLAPAVEVSRLGGITWHHTAHRDPGSYWNLLLASLSDLPLKPLVASSWCTGVDSVTVQQAFFGSPAQHTRRNWTPRFIHRYVNFMLSRLGVRGPSSKETRDLTSVGLIVRSGRRKILNRAQLKEATEQQGIALHFLHFEKMTPAGQWFGGWLVLSGS